MTSTGTTRWLALLSLVLALALPAVLMACGGDEPDAGGERVATPATEAATATAMPGDAPTATTEPRATATTATDAARPTATRAPLLTIGSTSAETDREALVAFYNATNGPRWRDDDNWLSDAPLDEWWGVETDDNGRVIELDLSAKLLRGEIPPELGSLASLRSLSFYRNELSGEIPPELGSLANLTTLYLNGNRLSGEIPPELGSLASLTTLYLNGNRLSGCVPSSLQGQVGNSHLGDLPFCS